VPWSAVLMVGATPVAVAGGSGPHAGVVLGVSAGLFWAASDTSIKALSDHLGDGAGAVLGSPLVAVIALASLAGLVVSARSLQIGKAVPVIAVTSVAANLFTIAAGPVVFGEPMPDTSLGVVVRVLAFALVIAAAALTPAPVRAAEPDPAG
jgi:hypothetical protein